MAALDRRPERPDDGVVALVAIVCLALLAVAPAAYGADYGIAAQPNGFEFSPSELTIAPGDTVTFSRADGGLYGHNVHFQDTHARCPEDLSTPASAWSCSRTYEAVGDFAFVCDAHPGMGGAVHVRVPGSEPPPDPGPGQPPGDPSPGGEPDVLSPSLELAGSRTQRVLRQGAVLVRVETSEAATVTASGTVNVPPPSRLYRLRRATRTTSGPDTVRLRLRLSRKTRRAVRSGLTYRRKLIARLRVTATDAAGNRAVKSRRVVLRR